MGKLSKLIDLAIILAVVNSIQDNLEKKITEMIYFSKKNSTSNWHCQFDVWPWIAEGYNL